MKAALAALALAPLFSYADTTIKCDYLTFGVPATSVEISIDANGEPAKVATVTAITKSSQKTVTPAHVSPNELVHVILSKEDPSNYYEMIVYRNPTEKGRSVLMNPNLPAEREMWGDCTGL